VNSWGSNDDTEEEIDHWVVSLAGHASPNGPGAGQAMMLAACVSAISAKKRGAKRRCECRRAKPSGKAADYAALIRPTLAGARCPSSRPCQRCGGPRPRARSGTTCVTPTALGTPQGLASKRRAEQQTRSPPSRRQVRRITLRSSAPRLLRLLISDVSNGIDYTYAVKRPKRRLMRYQISIPRLVPVLPRIDL
jgi:hypothetical protein